MCLERENPVFAFDDATSSYLTLAIMTGVAAVFVTIVLGYTIWCFYKMWGRMTAE